MSRYADDRGMKFLDVPQSGSFANITRSRNAFGQYQRTRATPVNPNTPRQAAVRARLGTLATEWRGLTAAQRTAWAAQAETETEVDSLGQTYSPTGFGWFSRINLRRLGIGETLLTDPPAPLTLVAGEVTAAAYDRSAALMSVTLAGLPDTGASPSGVQAVIWAGAPRSLGVSFDADLRQLGAYEIPVPAAPGDDVLINPPELVAAYDAAWGVPPSGTQVRIAVAAQAQGRRVPIGSVWAPVFF